MDMEKDIKEIFISEQQLDERINVLAKELSEEYKDSCPVVICVLKGAVVFMTELIKRMTVPIQIDFMSVSSYVGTESTGVINIKKDLDVDIEGRDLLIVEDILDTGLTLIKLVELLKYRNPKSIKICTMLFKDKDEENNRQRMEALDVEHIGFHISDEFVVGYGLDYDEKYRNLPYIGVLKEEVYLS